MRLQQRILSAEAVSTELFRNALKLAENRGLFDASAAERVAFAEDLRDLVRRVRVVARIDREAA
jgi:glycerol-3-phosphate O-acyltransferase